MNEGGPLRAELGVRTAAGRKDRRRKVVHTLWVNESVTGGAAQGCGDVLHGVEDVESPLMESDLQLFVLLSALSFARGNVVMS